jgi:hypothetical protein
MNKFYSLWINNCTQVIVFELQTKYRCINVTKPRNVKKGFQGTLLTRVDLMPLKIYIH